MIFSFFRKLRKIEFWTYIAYVIVLTICFQSVMVMVLTLLFLGYFRRLWRICDLISIYYLSVENCPCYLWIEIFDKLRICSWVWPKFCWENFGKLLVTFLAKIKTTVLQENHPCKLQGECLLFLVIRVQIRSDLSFLPNILVSVFFGWSSRCIWSLCEKLAL